MHMKRTTNFTLLMSVLALVAVATPARAAELARDFVGTRCNGTGIWHFVNPQTDGSPGATLTVIFSCGPVTLDPMKVNQNNQQWVAMTTSDCTLIRAFNNLPG